VELTKAIIKKGLKEELLENIKGLVIKMIKE
jgi:hypothetical protein